MIFATGADGVPDLDDPAAREHAFLLRKPYDVAALDSVLRAADEGRGMTE